MATTINKQRLLTHLFASAGKAAVPDAGEPLPVLEQMIYSLCREDATREQADRAYRNLREGFFDWNEVRVSSGRELEEALEDLSDPEARAQRIIALLQEVFEATFSFSLEEQHKKGLKQAAKQIGRYQAASDYTVAWVTQRSLGGHGIPVDPPTLRVVRRLGLLENGVEDVEAARASLEHQIPKVKGPAFTDQVSRLAEDYCREDEPRCSACPLASDCCHAQETGLATSGRSRAARPKPR